MAKRSFGRLARLGGLTSRVGGSYVGQRIKGVFQDEQTRQDELDRLHIRNAETVAKAMGRLKGAAMKLGQSIAQVTEGMDLPPEVSAALRTLNDKAEPVPFALLREDLEASLEAPVSELFSRIEEEPLGTASLAQAHAAWLPDGTPVVVKVLHRHIEATVDADLGAMRSLFIGAKVFNRDKQELEDFFDEVRERLMEELDYYHEAANIEAFKAVAASLPGLRIPITYPSHCSDRVLTMDRLPGRPLDAFLVDASPEARQRAGLILAKSFFEEVYVHRMLHADPHAGNYLFEDDGTVGLLDFGCVKRFDEHWVANYARVAEAGFHDDRATAIALTRQLGGIRGHDPEAEQLLWELIQLMAQPFKQGRYTAGGQHDSTQEQLRALAPRFVLHPEIRAARDMVYLHRALGGIYAMMRRLQVRADWGALASPYHQHAIAVSEGRC